MRTFQVGVATLVLGLISQLDAFVQRSSNEPKPDDLEDGDVRCDALCPTWTQHSLEERCAWHKCKGCDGCTSDSHDIPSARNDENDGGEYDIHLQRFDEMKPAKVKASPEFKTTYSIAGEAERGALDRSSEKMDNTNTEAPMDGTPADGAEAVEAENSWHEKGEAPVEVAETVETDRQSDKAPELKETGSKNEKKKKEKNKSKDAWSDVEASAEVAGPIEARIANTWHSKNSESSDEEPEAKKTSPAKHWYSKDKASDDIVEVKNWHASDESSELSAEVQATVASKTWGSEQQSSDEEASDEETSTFTGKKKGANKKGSDTKKGSASKKGSDTKKNGKHLTADDDEMEEWKSEAAFSQPYVVMALLGAVFFVC